jgi:alpha-glucosidase
VLADPAVPFAPLGDAALEPAAGDASVRLRAGTALVEVTALAPDAFRVGMFPEGRPARYGSPALAPDPGWEPVAAEVVRDGDEAVELRTGGGVARVGLRPLRIGFADADGRPLHRDDPELGMGLVPRPEADVFAVPPGPGLALHKRREPGERFFGCGERTSGLEKTGSHQVFWNVDPPVGHTASLVNLYVSVPFTLSLHDGRARGLFLDSTHRVEADLAKADPGRVSWTATGGDLVYYAFCGPTPAAVLRRYTQLTGRIPLPPLWALGNQQSRWSYGSDADLRAVARELRERRIPCDVLYLDIDYMDGFRVFTWDRERFPDPAGLLADLRAQGFRVVTIVDPGVKVDEGYAVYRDGRARDAFCRTAEGDEYQNVVWPGTCAFPDFLDPRVRAWWGDLHRGLLDDGVAGIWCDMNEPSLFVPLQSTMPPDVVHRGEGGDRPRHHAEVHNAYGAGMARATQEGLLRHRPERRPFVISRSGYAGVQRHALLWTGDNSSWWEHLWMAMPQLQNLGLSGVPWAGTDVGGFFGDSGGELLARWTELGVLQPFCRNHSAQGTIPQEPWAFGEPWASACRAMIELRMRLLPYLYGLFEEAHRTGAPILRPLLFEHPGDPTTYTADDELLLGPALLAAPIARPGLEHRHVYLPAGTWSHWWSGERVDGPAHVLAHAPIGRPALYLRANTPLPLAPVRQHVEDGPADPLTLRVHLAPGAPAGEAALYDDAGEGFGYRDGELARRTVTCEAGAAAAAIRLGPRQGAFAPPRARVELELRGAPGRPAAVEVDGAEHGDWRHDPGEGVTTVGLAEAPGARTVAVRW